MARANRLKRRLKRNTGSSSNLKTMSIIETESGGDKSVADILNLLRAALRFALHVCSGTQKRVSPTQLSQRRSHRNQSKQAYDGEIKSILNRMTRMLALLESKWKNNTVLLRQMKDVIVSQRCHLHTIQSSGKKTIDTGMQTAHDVMNTNMMNVSVQTSRVESSLISRSQREWSEQLAVKLVEKEAQHKRALCHIADLESRSDSLNNELHHAQTKLHSQAKIIERLHKIVEAQRRMKDKVLALDSSKRCIGELRDARAPLHERPPRPDVRTQLSIHLDRVRDLQSGSDEERTDDSYD